MSVDKLFAVPKQSSLTVEAVLRVNIALKCIKAAPDTYFP